MTDKQKIDQFRRLIERVFSTVKERIEDQVDFNDKYQKLFKDEYETARKIVFAAKDSAFLQQLMKIYLDLYWTYRNNKNNVHFYKSDQLFQFLFEQSTKVADPSLFETWSGYIKDQSVLVSFNDRYTALDPYFQRLISNFITQERERRRSQRSLLDLLRDEYARTHGGKQPSLAELNGFDPKPTFKALIELQIDTVNKRWLDTLAKSTDDNFERFAKQLDSFSGYLKGLGNDDLLKLFQAFKQVQDPPYEMDVHRRVLYYGLHAIACIQLQSAALRKKIYQKNLNGLTPEEVEFFAGPVRRSNFPYRSNIVRALTGSLRDPAVAIGEIVIFLNTYLMAQARFPGKLSLLSLDETLRIHKKWEEIKDLGEMIGLAAKRMDTAALTRILSDPRNAGAFKSMREMDSRKLELSDGHVLGTRVLKAGSFIQGHPTLGTIAVTSIEKGDVVYVEFGAFKPQMFQASHAFLADRQFGEKLLEIHASTIGMVHLTQIIFIAMGFIPALVSGGIVGLIYEVTSFFVGNWLQEQIAKIDPTLAVVLGFALSLFGPRAPGVRKLKTDMIELPADRTGLSEVLNAGNRSAGGAADAAAARTKAIADPLGPTVPATIVEPPTLVQPPPRSPTTSVPTQTAASTGDSLVMRRMGAETRLRTATPKNENLTTEMGLTLPQTAAKNEEAAVRLGTGTDGKATTVTSEGATGGTVTYQPSATRPPQRPDTRFANAEEALNGKLSSTSSGTVAKGVARGSAARAIPPKRYYGSKPIQLTPRPDGLKARMRSFIKRAATIYREEMKLQDQTLPIWTQSTNAHKNTLDRLRGEFADVTEHGVPLTGVTGPGTVKNPNVRIADATYVDLNSAARKTTPADLHIELKLKAYPEQRGKVLRVSGEKNPDVTSDQIQAYEAAQTGLGVPSFVINSRGDIYALERGRWIKVGGPE